MLTETEVPVAYAMTKVVLDRQRDHGHPFHDFMCLWTAFNNIYRTLAANRGHLPHPKVLPGNVLSRKQNGSVRIPQVQRMPAETADIELAIGLLSDKTVDALLRMPETRFFAERIPSWNNRSIPLHMKDEIARESIGTISGKPKIAAGLFWADYGELDAQVKELTSECRSVPRTSRFLPGPSAATTCSFPQTTFSTAPHSRTTTSSLRPTPSTSTGNRSSSGTSSRLQSGPDVHRPHRVAFRAPAKELRGPGPRGHEHRLPHETGVRALRAVGCRSVRAGGKAGCRKGGACRAKAGTHRPCLPVVWPCHRPCSS